MLAFGAFHGLNPGMGWLFALSLGLQQRSERVIWYSLLPIAAGHAASIGLVAVLLLAGLRFISLELLQWLTAASLLAFGFYKLFHYYRHPRWVGMKVHGRDLLWWSFLMATAHGAGLMLAPVLLGMAGSHSGHQGHIDPALSGSGVVLLALAVHMLAMLLVMGATAWLVYRKLGLAVLRRRWVNFDLIWAVTLILVGAIALLVVWR